MGEEHKSEVKIKKEEKELIEQIDRLRVKLDFMNALNYAIAGFIFKGGEMNEVPCILREVATDYKEEIKR